MGNWNGMIRFWVIFSVTHIPTFFYFIYSQEVDGKIPSRTSANKVPNPCPKLSAPKTSFPTSLSLRTNDPGKPQTSPLLSNASTPLPQPAGFQAEASVMEPQPSVSQRDSAIQTQLSPSQDNVSSPQHHPLLLQKNSTEAPNPPSSSHERNNPVPQASHLPPDITQQLSFLLER